MHHQVYQTQTGLATKRIALPSPGLYGLLEEDPSVGRQRSRIASLFPPPRLSMLPSHMPFKKGSGSVSLLTNSRSPAHCLSSYPPTTTVRSLSLSMTQTMGKPNTLTSAITSFILILNQTPSLSNTLLVSKTLWTSSQSLFLVLSFNLSLPVLGSLLVEGVC